MKRYVLALSLSLLMVFLTGLVIAADVDLFLMHDKVGNPDFQPYFERTSEIAEKEIGISFTPVGYPTTDVYTAAVKAALPTSKAPNIFTWWSTYWAKELIDEDLLMVLACLYKYDISVPETWDQFITACDTLKANGVTPLNQTVMAEWPAFISFMQIVSLHDPDLYENLMEGRISYTDPAVKEATKYWTEMIKKDYFTHPSTDFFTDMPRMFNDDKLGMILAGTWYYQSQLIDKGISVDKVGTFILPSIKESAGNVIVMEISTIFLSKNGENLDAAVKLADWWMTPEGNAVFAGQVNSFPANIKSNSDYLPEIKVNLLNNIQNKNCRLVNRFWEATPTQLMLKVNAKLGEIIMYPDKWEKVLEEIEEIAADYWANN
jgi:ABC-type glycerol-3-phosphate transport system substrate-binding protein